MIPSWLVPWLSPRWRQCPRVAGESQRRELPVGWVEAGPKLFYVPSQRTYTFVYGPQTAPKAENELGSGRQMSDMRKMQRGISPGVLRRPFPVQDGEEASEGETRLNTSCRRRLYVGNPGNLDLALFSSFPYFLH